MKNVLFVAGALLLLAPVQSALAYDDAPPPPRVQHQMDHQEHRGYHQELNGAHDDAHDEGFRSRREHRDWHRADQNGHQDFHDDHPVTGHDHQNGYDGRPSYDARPNGTAYRIAPGINLWLGR